MMLEMANAGRRGRHDNPRRNVVMKITVSNGAADKATRTIEVEYGFGMDHASMVALFSPEIVFEHARDAMVIALQARVRAMLKGTDKKAPATNDAIHAFVAEWKPTVGRNTDPAKKVATATKIINGMSPDEKAKMIADLIASMAPVAKAAPVPEPKAEKILPPVNNPSLRKGRRAA